MKYYIHNRATDGRIGERNHNSKLTREKVALIKEEYSRGVTQLALAKRFGVSQNAIHRVISGKTWRPE